MTTYPFRQPPQSHIAPNSETLTAPSLEQFIETLPPQPFPAFARHELTQLRNELAASRREVADLTTSVDLLWEQIANLRSAVHRLEHAMLPTEHIGLAVTSEPEGS